MECGARGICWANIGFVEYKFPAIHHLEPDCEGRWGLMGLKIWLEAILEKICKYIAYGCCSGLRIQDCLKWLETIYLAVSTLKLVNSFL